MLTDQDSRARRDARPYTFACERRPVTSIHINLWKREPWTTCTQHQHPVAIRITPISLYSTPYHDTELYIPVTARVSRCGPPFPWAGHAFQHFITAANLFDLKSSGTSNTAFEVDEVRSLSQSSTMYDRHSDRRHRLSREAPYCSLRSVRQRSCP